jgi:hypothetical protein
VQWKQIDEWKPTLPSEPTSLAQTLRPAVPVITSHFVKPHFRKLAMPLTLEEGEKLISALRHSMLAWKEVQPSPRE